MADSSMPLKAIPTKILGRTFRSRCEARWALYFECMVSLHPENSIGWDYETVSIRLPSGRTYTPDFLFYGRTARNGGSHLIEIKPSIPSDEYMLMLREVGRRFPLLLVIGKPGDCRLLQSWYATRVPETKDLLQEYSRAIGFGIALGYSRLAVLSAREHWEDEQDEVLDTSGMSVPTEFFVGDWPVAEARNYVSILSEEKRCILYAAEYANSYRFDLANGGIPEDEA